MKETLSHVLLNVFCLHFPRAHHNYFFQRGFECVPAQFLSGNIRKSSVTSPQTFVGHLQHVFVITIFRLPRHLQDVFKTSWKTKNCYTEDIFKTFWRHVLKTSWRHVLKTSWRHVLKTPWRRLGHEKYIYLG